MFMANFVFPLRSCILLTVFQVFPFFVVKKIFFLKCKTSSKGNKRCAFVFFFFVLASVLVFLLSLVDFNPLQYIAENEGYANSLEQKLKAEVEAKVGNDPTILLRVPTVEKYRQIFHTLLFVEEVRMSLDIRQVCLISLK
jgi:hypothetical protein